MERELCQNFTTSTSDKPGKLRTLVELPEAKFGKGNTDSHKKR